MPILAAMFVKLFNFECSVYWSKDFLLLLQHRAIAKAKKRPFFNLNDSQNISKLPAQSTIAIHVFVIVAIFAVETGKSLKFHRFESA